ncbi:MAG TPA: NHL repeat-containing protein [Bacteroidota bacterium]
MAKFFAVTVVVFYLSGTGYPAPASLHSEQDTLLSEEYSFGSFRRATRLAFNTQGWLYVADAGENAVLLFTSPREKPTKAGGYGWGASSFDGPSGITTDGLTLYISDYNNHRIQRFDRHLNFLSSFSTRDTSFVSARFGFPSGIALSRLGDLFVLDSENSRILKFTRSLQFERSFGGLETERGSLRNPSKLLMTSQDRIVVLDEDRLLEFDYFGSFIRSFGEGVLEKPTAFAVDANGLVVVSENTLYWFSFNGVLTHTVPLSQIVSSEPLIRLQDVALNGDRLYLLLEHRVVVVKMSSSR